MWRSRVLAVMLGGLSFWTPTTVVELVTGRELSIVVGTLVPPAALLLCYLFVRRRYRSGGVFLSLWMLLGVFVAGPLMMMIGATSHGGGFSRPFGWDALMLLLTSTLIPIITVVMSSYDVTVLGLFFATVAMIIIHLAIERRRR